MIIRRRHTANFTTIGNALFADDRLEADEVGIMAWLLSKQDNWEVRRPVMMRRWRMGRDGMRRVLRNLIRYGWIFARLTRLSNGTVHVIYEVRDEPGPELTEDEARAALSLVSSGAGPGETSVDEEPSDGTEVKPEGADPPAGYGSPPTGQPEAASRLRQSHPGYREEDSLKPESIRNDSPKCGRAFTDVRAVWPSEHILSVATCEQRYADLSEGLKQAAFRGIKPYLDECREQSRKVCDLATYFRERRWERFEAKANAPKFCAIKRGTPQAYRWRDYFDHAEPSKLTIFDKLMADHGTYTVPSEWPPALPKDDHQPNNQQHEKAQC